MIDSSKYDLIQIRYSFDLEFTLSDSGKKFKPYNLINAEKISDYENNFFPIFKFHLKIKNVYFDLIFKTQTKLLCNLKIVKKYYSSTSRMTEEDNSSDSAYKQEIILQDTFVAFFDNIPNDSQSSSKMITEDDLGNEESKSMEDDTNLGSAYASSITVTLWHLNSLKTYKTMFNALFANCDVGTAIGYLINNTELITKAIIDLPDNKLEYEELVLLPYGLRNSFISLQSRYGVYFNGMWLFLDNGTFYCLKAFSNKHQHEKEKAGYTTIIVYESPNSLHLPYLIGINKEDKSYCYETDGVLKRTNIDVALGELLGDSMIYSNFETIINSVEGNNSNPTIQSSTKELIRSNISHKDTGKRLDMDYDELNNPYNMTALMRKNTITTMIPLIVKSVDIDSFTPEKTISLKIADLGKNNEYGGSYSIKSVHIIFQPDKSVNNRFETTAIANLQLIKVPDDILSL